MRQRTKHRRVLLIRRALLVLLVLIPLVLLGLFVLARSVRIEMGGEEGRSDLRERMGEGIDQIVTHEGKPVFRVRGVRGRRDAEGNLHVEEVLVTLYHEDEAYEIAADQATYNVDAKEATMRGDVSLAGPGGAGLATEILHLRDRGDVILSEGEVAFRYGGDRPLQGRADRLRAELGAGLFVLVGDVQITEAEESVETFGLTAQRLVVAREERVVRAEGQVDVKWERQRLRARRVAAHLDSERDVIHFIRAHWGVRADLEGAEGAGMRRASAEAVDLSLLMSDDGSDPRRLELEGAPDAVLRLHEEGERLVKLTAPVIEAVFTDGAVTTAAAVGGVEMNEWLPTSRDVTLSYFCADRATAHFAPTGEMVDVELSGSVEIHRPGQQITADRAVAGPTRFEAWGDPVHLLGPQGEAWAPQLDYTEEGGIAHLEGGVEAVLTEEAGSTLEATPLVAGGEPVRVTAEEAFWRLEPRSFLFSGQARAWSGERLLSAHQIRGDLDEDRLSAAGGVETIWFTEPGQAEEEHRIEVAGETMVYDRVERSLVYEGKVVAEEGDRVLRCRRLTVHLDAEGEAERLVCEGEVVLEAPEEGRTVRASRAEYDLARREATFTGSPVELVDREGGNLKGGTLVYHLDTETVRIVADAGGSR